MLVDSFMRVNKTVPARSPEHYVYDVETKRFVL
jgi:hypothetical protein